MANRLNVQNIYASDIQSTPSVTINGSGISAGTLGSGVVFPAGHVIQTVQYVETGAASITSSSTNTFASFSVPFQKGITPISSSSKILVSVNISVGHDLGTLHIALYRDGSKVTGAAGDVASDRFGSTAVSRYSAAAYSLSVNSISFNYLDSPTIPSTPVEIDYEIKATLGLSYSATFYLNRSALDTDADYGPRTASFITLFEIAQ
jgi:hypothetical protein